MSMIKTFALLSALTAGLAGVASGPVALDATVHEAVREVRFSVRGPAAVGGVILRTDAGEFACAARACEGLEAGQTVRLTVERQLVDRDRVLSVASAP